MQNSEIILIGGSGKTGGRIADRLARRGLGFRFASRSSARPFDWEKRADWAAALTGAKSAYVSFQPDLAVSWAAEAIGALACTAVDCGLTHIVLLSGRGEEGAQRSEEALKASGIGYTILRASWFCQNFSEGAFAGQIAARRAGSSGRRCEGAVHRCRRHRRCGRCRVDRCCAMSARPTS